MSKYKRPNFDGDWWQEVEQYLQEHPEEGFSEDQVKEFMKYVVNKHMNTENNLMTKDELKDVIEEVRKSG